jgi:hypothetical protein
MRHTWRIRPAGPLLSREGRIVMSEPLAALIGQAAARSYESGFVVPDGSA